MTKKTIIGMAIFLLIASSVMAGLNFKSGSETQSAITETTNGNTIDLAGYSGIGIQVSFATCTGAAADSATLVIQTSMDNSNWVDLITLVAYDSGAGHSGDNHFHYIPDGATANEGGFLRYIRYRCVADGSPSLSYTIKWIAKE